MNRRKGPSHVVTMQSDRWPGGTTYHQATSFYIRGVGERFISISGQEIRQQCNCKIRLTIGLILRKGMIILLSPI